MNDIIKAMALASVSVFAVTGGTASAQDMSGSADTAPVQAEESAANDEIVVTAQRREQSLSDVGMSITAIGAETLTTRNITAVEDLSKLVTGLSVSDSGFSTPIYTLRGVGINEPSVGSSSSVAIYVDEVPLAYPITTQGAALDLQRIEVLKGPQGTLYGQNSTGGAINYIANKPTDEFEAGVTGSFGRFSRGTLEGFVSGPLGPTLRARVAARGIWGSGWQKSITRDDSIGKVKNFTGRAILEWEPDEDFQVTFNVNGWIDKSDTMVSQFVRANPSNVALADPDVVNAPIPPANARATDWDPGRDFDRNDKFWQASMRAEWAITDQLSLTSITAYMKMDREQVSELDGIANAVALVNAQQGTIESLSQEVRLAADFSGVRWILGANIADDETSERVDQDLRDSSQVQSILGRRATGSLILADQKINSWAVFTNIEIPLTEQLTFAGGIRLSEETRKFRGCGAVRDAFSSPAFTGLVNVFRGLSGLAPIAAVPPGQCVSMYTTAAALSRDTGGAQLLVPGFANRELTENNVPWNLNLNWKPSERSLIYVRVSRGYKAGNFSALNTTDNIAYDPVVQEKLTAYELGGRISISRALRLEAAIFQYDYINKQLRARINVGPPFGNINGQANIPESRLKGAEFSAVVRPVDDLTFALSGVYIDSKILRFSGFTVDGVFQNLAGSPFNFTPKYSLNADLNYKHPISDNLEGFAGVNVAYRSKTSATFTPPGYTRLSTFDINEHTLVDAQLGVESEQGNWRVWVWGKNIFNKYYWTNVLRVSDVEVKYPGMPATYGLTASIKF